MLGDDAYFDWQVLPEYEGKGIEDEALAWAEGLLAELRAGDAERWKGPMMVGTRQDNAERIAFLEEHGFHRGEYVEVNMLRSLDDPIGEQAAASRLRGPLPLGRPGRSLTSRRGSPRGVAPVDGRRGHR